jgi:ring-1,2-phenylacetyl-CoA epoxidase subunit PaaC
LTSSAASVGVLFEYLLRLGDTDVVLAQRLGEWVGHGPVLEEDIALANVGLDLLGQGRMWLSYAGEVEARVRGKVRTEDELAFLRDGGAYRNLLLAEMPNGDFAATMARQFYFDQYHLLLLRALTRSADPRVAEIAAKGAKEVAYHAERSMDWVVRLGDGTDESHARMQRALDNLWMYTGEMFTADAAELALAQSGIGVDARTLRAPWLAAVTAIVADATLALPQGEWMQGSNGRGGKQGVHTEHLGHLLTEMQFLQRAYPGAQW